MDDRLIHVFLSSIFYIYTNYRNAFAYGQTDNMEKMILMLHHLVEEMAGSKKESQKTGSWRTLNDAVQRNRWSPPLTGWIKINTDAAFNMGRTAVGLVVRDEKGWLQFSSANVTMSRTTREA